MAQDTHNWLWVLTSVCDKCTELQDLVKMWELSRVPPQQSATQGHLEMLSVHTKPSGYAPEYWVFFLIEA